jgi:hypothetical protein
VVPEPGATILLLVLGVTSIAVWRRRGEEPTASRPATPPSARP